MDRQNKADDNAEHLYRYSLQQKDYIKKYFVISSDSPDYIKLKQEGNILQLDSYKYKFMSLLADKVISSHADEWVINPFAKMEKYYRGIKDTKFVFLQHGITKHDLSSWLNKYNKNVKLFITAANKEYESIVNGNYNYDSDIVKLTGFPRYDNLIDNNKKQVLIMPTWRKQLVNEKNGSTGIRPYSTTFKDSVYFNMYNSLINDKRIILKAKEKGYKLVFFPHPDMQQQLRDFGKDDDVEFPDYSTKYQTLFNQSSLLITDYSSVAFDFAYLKKPVVYFQFDKQSFHWDKGYFDNETMGFGETVYHYEELVNKIIDYIENDCIMKEKYVKRVEEFYAFTDRNNCKRVYEAIKEMD